MSSPPVFMDFDSDGKAVCWAHQLRICGKCCFDFTFDEEDGDDSDDAAQSTDSSNRANDGISPDQVFVLVGGAARFVPQWDEQVMGPRNVFSLGIDYDSPPKPLPISSISVDECAKCHAVWLAGNRESGAEIIHPSHHTINHGIAGTRRSLVVQVEGLLSGNGSSEQQPPPRVAIGVYFGAGSPFNVSEELVDHGVLGSMVPRATMRASSSSTKNASTTASAGGSAASSADAPKPPTTREAQLAATVRALQTVRSQVLPFRRTLVDQTAPASSLLRSMSSNLALFRVVVATSHFIVDAVCVQLPKWRFDATRKAYRNKRGKLVDNSALFALLDKEVWALARLGVQVVFWEVPKEELVATAGALAKLSLV